jgi:hypothetical protein
MVRLALGLMIIALSVVSARPARAEISVGDGVPFTEAELRNALAVREVDDGNVIIVRAVSASAIELKTGGGRQRIELGTTRGAQAARLVALHLAPRSLAPALPDPTLIVSPMAPPPAVDRGWVIALSAGGGRGMESADLAFGVLRVDAISARGPWRWGFGMALFHGFERAIEARPPLQADLGALRLLGGIAAGPLELVAGPEIVFPVGGTGPQAMLGAAGGLRVLLVGAARWQVIASADLDLFPEQVVVRDRGFALAATPRFALAAALGVARELP